MRHPALAASHKPTQLRDSENKAADNVNGDCGTASVNACRKISAVSDQSGNTFLKLIKNRTLKLSGDHRWKTWLGRYSFGKICLVTLGQQIAAAMVNALVLPQDTGISASPSSTSQRPFTVSAACWMAVRLTFSILRRLAMQRTPQAGDKHLLRIENTSSWPSGASGSDYYNT